MTIIIKDKNFESKLNQCKFRLYMYQYTWRLGTGHRLNSAYTHLVPQGTFLTSSVCNVV